MDAFKNRLSYRIVFSIDSICLLLILAFQGAAMYYFFNQPYKVLFFIVDVICIVTFIITMIISYNHFTKTSDISETDNKFVASIKKQLQKVDFGLLPLSYVCWLVYVIILVWKLNIIIGPPDDPDLWKTSASDGCVNRNSTICKFVEDFGPYKWRKSILLVCVALSAPVFMLLIEGHNWHKRSSESYSYLTDMCKKAAIEIFDSVEMFGLLIERNDMSLSLERIIFQLASLNIVLPTLLLYQLNINNFGVKTSRKSFRLNIFHNILKIVAINIPFFIARYHMWIVTKDVSVFIIKNIFSVILSLRELYIDIWLYLKPVIPTNKSANEEVPLNQTETTQTDGTKMTARL